MVCLKFLDSACARGQDARVPPHVLGQEDPRMDREPRASPRVRSLPQR